MFSLVWDGDVRRQQPQEADVELGMQAMYAKVSSKSVVQAMYAKVFVADGAAAKLVDVVAPPLEAAAFLIARNLPNAPSTFALAATTSSESTYTRLIDFAAGMAVSMIIAGSLRLWRTPQGRANMREPFL